MIKAKSNLATFHFIDTRPAPTCTDCRTFSSSTFNFSISVVGTADILRTVVAKERERGVRNFNGTKANNGNIQPNFN